MYSVISKSRVHSLSIDCIMELFDRILLPIVTYGCEVWGFSNIDLLERFHLKFCKYILKIRRTSPNFMVYGELGRYPISVDIKVRTIMYWANLVQPKREKLPSKLYMLAVKFDLPWVKNVKKIFDDCGLSYIWNNQSFVNRNWLKSHVKMILMDQYKQFWNGEVFNSPKGLNYRIFKNELEYERYLDVLSTNDRILLTKFRTCNFKLPIETGRWQNIPRNQRKCQICSKDEIGNEYHYLFNCNSDVISNARMKYLPIFYTQRPNTYKFTTLFNTKDEILLKKLCKFLSVIEKRVTTIL